MSISSAILALSPLWYWKLDDASGPAAADSSGNSRPGAYYGGFGLRKPGPESGTYCAQFFQGGARKLAPSYITSGQTMTLMCWAAIGAVDSGLHIMLANASSTAGGSMIHQPSNGGIVQFGVTKNNISNTLLNAYSLDLSWHHYAVVFTGTGVTIYVDGVAMGSVAGAVNAFNSGVDLSVAGSLYGYVAHFAGWNSALTVGQISGVTSAPAALDTPAFASQQSTTGTVYADLSTITAKLDQIIAAVIRTYSS